MINNKSKDFDIFENISNIRSSRDLYFLLGIFFGCDDSLLSKLFMYFDPEVLVSLIVDFGGKNVKFPTYDELMESLKIISIIYLYDIKGWSFAAAMRSSGFTYHESMNQTLRKELIEKRNYFIERVQGVFKNGKHNSD